MPPRAVCRCCFDYFPTYFLCILLVFWSVTYIMLYCVWHLMHSHEKNAMGISFLVFYTIFLVMFIWSHFETMCQDQAEVPDQYRFNEMDSARLENCDIDRMNDTLKTIVPLRGITIFTRLSDMKIRYCRYCHLIKPDRTHHCATCQTCSMKMDHHCPFINGCIAFYNYKQFLLVQFYGFLLSSWIVATISVRIDGFFHGFYDHVLMVLTYFSAMLAMIFFCVLLIYHLYLLSTNKTALESRYDLVFVPFAVSFNLGCCQNFTEVCGDNACCWLCPIFTSKGNGHEFPVRGPAGTTWIAVEK